MIYLFDNKEWVINIILPSSEVLTPAADGNKYIEPQSDTTKSKRRLERHKPKWDIFNSYLQNSGNPKKEKVERI